MKYCILAIYLFALNAYSQSGIAFTSDSMLIYGINTGVYSSQINSELKGVEKAWKSFVKSKYKKKVEQSSDYLVFEETASSFVLSEAGTFIFYPQGQDSLVAVHAAYRLAGGVYLSADKHPEGYARFKAVLEEFVYRTYFDILPKQIKSKEKELKNLNKEKDKAVKANDASAKLISKNQKKIEKNQSSIKKIEKKISKLKADDVKKNEYNNEITKLINENAELKRASDFNQGSIDVNKKNIEQLMPQIDLVAKALNQLKLLFMEVEAKVKLYK